MRKVIEDAINLLGCQYPNIDKRKFSLLYHMALEDMPDNQIQHGLGVAVRTPNRFMPDSGTFRGYCEFDQETKADLAWAEAMRKANYTKTPEFKDALIPMTIKIAVGTWVDFCRLKEDRIPFAKREFKKTYTTLQRSGVRVEAKLTGAIHRQIEGT